MAYRYKSTYIRDWLTAHPDEKAKLLRLAKKALGISPQIEMDDELIQLKIDGAVGDADRYCSNDFDSGPVEPKVLSWIIDQAVMGYENPDPSVVSKSVNGTGSETREVDEVKRYAPIFNYSLKSPVRSTRLGYY